MLVLILGGSGSGKSAFAEDYVCSLAPQEKYYIATMEGAGEESARRIERHRQLRAGKGFETIERPRDVGAIGHLSKEGTALLECMSNLTANEMFVREAADGGWQRKAVGGEAADGKEAIGSAAHFCILSADIVAEKVLAEVEQLYASVRHLVIVSCNVFEDGAMYDASTREYLRALGRINAGLARRADAVAEIVVGIPQLRKGSL